MSLTALDEDRRRFLRYGLGLAGAGGFSLGLADLLNPGILGGVAPPTNSTSTATTSTGSGTRPTSSQYSSYPDYQDFLSWWSSVSGKYSGKSLNISLEAEFGPYAAQLRNGDFERATGIKAGPYDIKPYALQLQTV